MAPSKPVLPILALLPQRVNLRFQVPDIVPSIFNGSLLLAAFFLPASDPFLFLAYPVVLGVELVADLALLLDPIGCHDELHTAGLAGTVLFGAVLAERSPFVVAALVDILIEETHVAVLDNYWGQHLKQ
jgi:hypothetical protein